MNKSILKIRLNNFKKELKNKQIDAGLITSEVNRFYFSCFKCGKAFFLITQKKCICLTDGRYYHRAQKEIGSFFKVIEMKKDFKYDFLLLLKKQKIKILGIEHKDYTLNNFKNLTIILRGKKIKVADVSKIINNLRSIKDHVELKAIQKAAQITDKTFNYIFKFIKDNYKSGLNEKEVAWVIEKFIRENGGDDISFKPIVASGPNSAFPHHCSGMRTIKYGDAALLDFGSMVNGYCSDMTRTIFIGNPAKKQKEVYNLVLKAQIKALEKIKHGANICVVDNAARNIIDNSKYKNKFLHGCGHGVGLEIHELPNLRQNNTKEIFKEGMVITVEPGVYLNKQFGVRIEDLVLVSKNGYKYLSKSVKIFDDMIIAK